MNFRLVDSGWDRELTNALRSDGITVRIVCPFIKQRTLERLLNSAQPRAIQVVTRFNLVDFSEGVSDLGALRALLDRGAQVRGVRNLHAKLYLFGDSLAMATSANLTDAALLRNHEFGFVAGDPAITKSCNQYFENLWSRAGNDLTAERLSNWESKLAQYLAGGAKPIKPSGLSDEGVDAGVEADIALPTAPWAGDATQAFVKFLGDAGHRAPLSLMTLDELVSGGCHWALAYPKAKRPTGVQDGALMFIARMTRDPNDIRIFGRAIAMRYKPGRDDATDADIALRAWKETWPRYVRVHHGEFVAGSLANGVSLNELMRKLQADAFAPTRRNAEKKTGNVDPRRAYLRQPAVELTSDGLAWLNTRLEEAFATHGKLSAEVMASLDWPELPPA